MVADNTPQANPMFIGSDVKFLKYDFYLILTGLQNIGFGSSACACDCSQMRGTCDDAQMRSACDGELTSGVYPICN